jgi:hypothetical protein
MTLSELLFILFRWGFYAGVVACIIYLLILLAVDQGW